MANLHFLWEVHKMVYFKDGKLYNEEPNNSNQSMMTTSSQNSLIDKLSLDTIIIMALFIMYIALFATKHYMESGFVFAFLLGWMI